MYSYFKGELTHATSSYIILECVGVGYQIYIPTNVFTKLPQIGTKFLVYTSYVVREASQSLYGFLEMHDRDLFELLMTVSGIGPKIALSIISHISIHDLYSAIGNHDIGTLSKIPGIGKKTAERLILDLRDKLHSVVPVGPDPRNFSTFLPKDAQMIQDAMSALIHLGYNQMIAQKAIKKTLKEYPEGMELTQLITVSLKNI